MAKLTARLLGGFGLEHDGAPVDLGSARAQALVAYLLLERDRPLARASLAGHLWPDADEGHARTNLRKALHQLRRTVPEVELFMELDGQQVFWRTDSPYELDVQRFEAAVAGAAGAMSAEGEVACLAVAAETYRGDLLPELYEEWLEPERDRLRDEFARVLARLACLHEEQRDYRSALRFTQRQLRHDPLDEGSYRRLMRLHGLCGERAKALHAFHGCASMLQREFGVDPPLETRVLYEQLLRDRLLPMEPGPRSSADGAVPETALRAAPRSPALVGREPQMALLRSAWLEANRGRASMVLVSGDAGIGKTRLAKEFVRSVSRREVGVAWARCHAAEGALALAPLSELLRSEGLSAALSGLDPVWRGEVSRLLPELVVEGGEVPGPLMEGWERRRLFEALARVVLMGQPLVVLIDDVQWCDRDSLEWLHFLLRFDGQAKLLLIATARAHDVPSNGALVELLGALRGEERLLEVELGPLDVVQTAELVRGMRGEAPSPCELGMLFDETEGNPLFVVEMVREGVGFGPAHEVSWRRSGAARLPAKLREVIAARLGQLEPADLELAGMAAVIGREFGFELLVCVSRWDEEGVLRGLDELWRRRIVREVGAGRYDFSHDKLREVAYEGLSLTRRRLLHRFAAEALEAQDTGDVSGVSGQLAFHYDRAGFAERAVGYYQRAAEEARALFAHAEAVGAYERALVLLDALPAGRSMEGWRHALASQLLEGIGDVLTLQGDHEAAESRFAGALEHHLEGEGVALARLWRKIGATYMSRYRYHEALEAFVTAESALGPERAGATTEWWQEWIEIGTSTSWMHYWQVNWRENAKALSRIERAVERYGTLVQRGNYYRCMSAMLMAKERFVVSEEAVKYLRAGLAASLEAGSPSVIALAQFTLGFGLLWRDELDEAQSLIEESLSFSERSGHALTRARCLTYLGFVHRKRREVEAAESYALQGLELASDLVMPEYAGAAHGHLSWLAWRRGDLDESVRQGWAAVDRWREGQPYMLQWSAYLPLLAAISVRGQLGDAAACAVALLDTKQQRLPDALNEALERVASGEQASLERVVALAEEARLI